MAGSGAPDLVGLTMPLFPLDPAGYQPHALHSAERMWPQTNCYVDLWIEILNALGTEPRAMLGFTVTQDFEGDQFTFFKVPLEDLEALYDIRVTELAIFDDVAAHVCTQLQRGRLCLVEMDSFYMPDTRGVGYRQEHGKTTVGINRLDRANRSMDYFHNDGFFRVEGDDFDGLFQNKAADDALPFLPYTEFVKFPKTLPDETHIRKTAEALLQRHLARRPQANPLAAFAAVFAEQVRAIAERPFGFFHKYAFNTVRQFGANFELLASHLDWLDANRYTAEKEAALKIAEVAKSLQFQLARAVTRKKFEPLATALDPAIAAWDSLMDRLNRSFRHP
ncbi:DUF1839 family protein [Allorhizobium sp. BGMRC 0089]|uniref:DUF1839 family protein n=1 Tax=Allorhizobium sonneratiae TaxID=2934936 RepID=UPI0020336449|nr:DUF1839 family protein [Allorhizobium sonneratiae]MCM2294729.1 DUF1839 family protein [Allorhizobium sonneratiae]